MNFVLLPCGDHIIMSTSCLHPLCLVLPFNTYHKRIFLVLYNFLFSNLSYFSSFITSNGTKISYASPIYSLFKQYTLKSSLKAFMEFICPIHHAWAPEYYFYWLNFTFQTFQACEIINISLPLISSSRTILVIFRMLLRSIL